MLVGGYVVIKANASAKHFAKALSFCRFAPLVPGSLTVKTGYGTAGQTWCTTLPKSVVVNLLFMNGGEVAAVHKDKQPAQQRCFELLCSFGKEI